MKSAAPSWVYRTERMFVVHKPAGIPSVKGETPGSLAEWLEQQGVAAGRDGEAGLVQRLDTDTSGLMLGAFDNQAHQVLREMIQQGKVYKEYRALLEGEFRGTKEITCWLGSRYRSSKKVQVWPTKPMGSSHAARHALEATSTFVSKEVVDLPSLKTKASWVTVVASVARRHQVRAHAALLGHPLVGDDLYGAALTLDDVVASVPEIAPRQQGKFILQACRVRFVDPWVGEEQDISLRC